ncbi:hypothetical protein CEXT_96671 [Caerostris extrusa]|uniref:Uncharacterized protein n=1 Tax=Caerostris extrusa TaxID=172846 RepID=A0AAV4RMM2_CAEEX|nr:hypothetical protein CEXT_96671 [Caerostris extrusa]
MELDEPSILKHIHNSLSKRKQPLQHPIITSRWVACNAPHTKKEKSQSRSGKRAPISQSKTTCNEAGDYRFFAAARITGVAWVWGGRPCESCHSISEGQVLLETLTSHAPRSDICATHSLGLRISFACCRGRERFYSYSSARMMPRGRQRVCLVADVALVIDR